MMVSGSIVNAGVSSQAATTEKTGKDVVAGVNGEFFTANGPEGYLIKDGCPVINGVMVPGVNGKNYPLRAFFGVRKDGSVLIGNYGEDWEREKDNLVQASGGQFWMVKDGVVQDFSDQIVTDTSDPNYDEEAVYRYGTHPRTAVGIREDGSVFFVVVDGRGSDGAEGFTIEKLGQYMKDLGAYQALNMDGGGSSTAVTLNRETGTYEVQNTPSDATGERQVLSSLLVLVPEPTLKLNLSGGALQGVTAHNFEDGSVAVIARYNSDGTKLLDKRLITISGAGEKEEGKYFTLSEPMTYDEGDQFRLYAWNSLSEMTSSMAPQVATFQSGDGAVSGDLALNQVSYEESEHTFPLEAATGDEYFLQQQSAYTSSPEDGTQREIGLSYEYDKESKTVSGKVSLIGPASGIQVTLLAVKKDADLSSLKESDIYYLSEVPTDENGQVKYSFTLDTVPEDYKLVISAPTAEQRVYALTQAPITDKTALNAEIASAQTLRQEDYTSDSWGPFAQALAEAVKVSEDSNAAQTQIDSALEALRTARNALEKLPDEGDPEGADKTALEQLVAEALKLQESDYTPESWKNFAEALAGAQAVLNAENAAQSQIDEALNALKQAKEGLVQKAASGTENSSSNGEDVPQTGDRRPVIWLLLAGACLLVLVGMISVRTLQTRHNE